jgi:hypothetical protein
MDSILAAALLYEVFIQAETGSVIFNVVLTKLPSKLGAVVQDYKPNYLEGGRDWEDGG